VKKSKILLKNAQNSVFKSICFNSGIKISSNVNSLVVAISIHTLEIGPKWDFFNSIREF
jgi:hypothetical protein